MNKKNNWYELTKRYNNVDYKAGSWDINEGLDCLSLIILFLEDMGFDVEKYKNGEHTFKYGDKEFNANNYAEILDNRKDATKALFSFIKSKFVKVDKTKKGDVVILSTSNDITVGIYTGQQTVLTSVEGYGCKVIKIKNFDVLGAYRWVPAQNL